MALVVKDRVKEVTTTTGTSNLTLGGAVYGFQSFATIGNGNTTYYGIYDSATGDWEVGVGTYSTTGPTLTRDTVLESSNSGSKVVFGAGSKDVFVTYPAERSVYLDAAGSAVTVLDIGTLGVSTANISTANITAGTISTTPTSSNDLVNKTYVDAIAAQGISYHTPVKYEVPSTTGNLTATYNNGASGVGATLTNAGTQTAFTPDGVVAQVGDRILIYNQTNAAQNGVYQVTTVGSGSTNWVLTRTSDADTYGVKSPTALGAGDAFYVTSGNTGAGETYVCNTAGTITFGTTAITFAQISSAQVYSAGAGLTLSNLQFSLTPVGTASTYGSASSVPVFTTNAYGQVTSVTNTGISITAGAVSGLAPSATTDTTNASNITSGTLGSARLTGSYTGITGVGTLTAGTWTATTIGATYGGTGLTTFTQGDLLYATSSTALGRLADVATGNALISGGVGGDPAWGKIGLQTHVDGTLQVTNGGTGATTLTGYVKGNGTSAFTASATIPNSDTTATSANTASAIVARDGSGNFSAGTITASLSGNASTATSATSATTATNLAGGTAGAIPYQSGSGTTLFSAAGTSGQYLQSNGTSAPSWSNLPAVNNGTLTLATSGTGLSGSATFTANQSGNSTFTVTSNATSGNTASTIVARDASGNFSAGTITASLSGNATSATQVSNSVTFNNGGGGGASGSTFNGSGALTVSYNTIGAPSTTGTNASGTWGINVTGSAGSSPLLSALGNYVWSASTLPTGYNQGIQCSFVFSGWQSYGSVMTMSTYSGGGGALQMYVPYSPTFGGTGLQVRFGNYDVSNGNSWTSWKTLLASDNYNSYAPTLTGGGASGTWNINITGSAGSASSSSAVNASTSTGIQSSFSTTINTTTPGTGFYGLNFSGGGTADNASGITWAWSSSGAQAGIYVQSSGAYGTRMYLATTDSFATGARTAISIDPAGIVTTTRNYLQAAGSLRAPIFYDSDNTGYYIDAASTSFLYGLTLAGGSYFRPQNWIQFDSSYGLYWPNTNAASELNANAVSSYGNIRITGNRNGWAGIYDAYSAVNGVMYDSGGYGGVYREANGRWYWYYHLANDCMGIGTSSTSSTYSLYLPKGVYAQSRIDATIFYDTNNTGYYVDPASTSELNKVYYNSNMVSRNYGIGQVGLYSSVRYQAVFSMGEAYLLPADGTTTGNLYGIAWSHPNAGGAASNLASHGMLILENGSFQGAWGGGRLVTPSDIRGTIFYDYNNTGYYVDPASTTSLRTVGDWRSDAAAWTGEFSGKIQYHASNWYFQYAGNAIFRNSGGTNVMVCDTSGNVTFNGNVTAYSDARLKENVVTIDSALEKALRLRGVYYNKIGENIRKAGVIAQELLDVFPEVVRSVSETNPSTGETQELYAVDYGNLTGLLIEAIKELSAKVDALK